MLGGVVALVKMEIGIQLGGVKRFVFAFFVIPRMKVELFMFTARFFGRPDCLSSQGFSI